MFYWATSSFEFLQKNYEVQLIFVVLKEHTEKYNIDVEIKKYYPNAIIIELDKITRGQAETVFMTKNYINNYNKLIIFNSDTYTIFDENDFPIDDEKIE
jgi:hypothetical protein